MDDKRKSAPEGTDEALKKLLHQIADHPELTERITITIKPQKLLQQKPGR